MFSVEMTTTKGGCRVRNTQSRSFMEFVEFDESKNLYLHPTTGAVIKLNEDYLPKLVGKVGDDGVTVEAGDSHFNEMWEALGYNTSTEDVLEYSSIGGRSIRLGSDSISVLTTFGWQVDREKLRRFVDSLSSDLSHQLAVVDENDEVEKEEDEVEQMQWLNAARQVLPTGWTFVYDAFEDEFPNANSIWYLTLTNISRKTLSQFSQYVEETNMSKLQLLKEKLDLVGEPTFGLVYAQNASWF